MGATEIIRAHPTAPAHDRRVEAYVHASAAAVAFQLRLCPEEKRIATAINVHAYFAERARLLLRRLVVLLPPWHSLQTLWGRLGAYPAAESLAIPAGCSPHAAIIQLVPDVLPSGALTSGTI